MLRAVRVAIGAALFASASAPSVAASISATTISGSTIISVQGELILGDDKKFIDVALPLPGAIVFFASPGGSLVAGIEMGKAIRLKGFVTAVADGDVCASACALAWLGGRKRFIASSSRVGFHAAFKTSAGGVNETTGSGNALVGAYLNQLGLPSSAVVYITDAPPDGMNWLTAADAQRRGIDVDVVTAAASAGSAPSLPARPVDPTPLNPRRVPISPNSMDWTVQGEWVQAASRPTLPEAIAVAVDIKIRTPNTSVFRYANGWYGVVVGPFAPDQGSAALQGLLAIDNVPADSLVTRGDRFTELAWGAPRARVASAIPPTEITVRPVRASYQAQALSLANQFNATWSSDNATAISFLAQSYEDEVEYFGKVLPKASVLKEKMRFAERWSRRNYTVKPESVSTECEEGPAAECMVLGIVDWVALAPEKGVRSTGAAAFKLRIGFRSGAPRIIGESSVILHRERSISP